MPLRLHWQRVVKSNLFPAQTAPRHSFQVLQLLAASMFVLGATIAGKETALHVIRWVNCSRSCRQLVM